MSEDLLWIPIIYNEPQSMPHFYLRIPGYKLVYDDDVQELIRSELIEWLNDPENPIPLTDSLQQSVIAIDAEHPIEDVSKLTMKEFVKSGGYFAVYVQEKNHRDGYFTQSTHLADVASSLFVTTRSTVQRLEKDLSTTQSNSNRRKQQWLVKEERLQQQVDDLKARERKHKKHAQKLEEENRELRSKLQKMKTKLLELQVGGKCSKLSQVQSSPNQENDNSEPNINHHVSLTSPSETPTSPSEHTSKKHPHRSPQNGNSSSVTTLHSPSSIRNSSRSHRRHRDRSRQNGDSTHLSSTSRSPILRSRRSRSKGSQEPKREEFVNARNALEHDLERRSDPFAFSKQRLYTTPSASAEITARGRSLNFGIHRTMLNRKLSKQVKKDDLEKKGVLMRGAPSFQVAQKKLKHTILRGEFDHRFKALPTRRNSDPEIHDAPITDHLVEKTITKKSRAASESPSSSIFSISSTTMGEDAHFTLRQIRSITQSLSPAARLASGHRFHRLSSPSPEPIHRHRTVDHRHSGTLRGSDMQIPKPKASPTETLRDLDTSDSFEVAILPHSLLDSPLEDFDESPLSTNPHSPLSTNPHSPLQSLDPPEPLGTLPLAAEGDPNESSPAEPPDREPLAAEAFLTQAFRPDLFRENLEAFLSLDSVTHPLPPPSHDAHALQSLSQLNPQHFFHDQPQPAPESLSDLVHFSILLASTELSDSEC
ncbi:hypothetical protein BLNAU_9179 [Blattamonas nauphoetae]|uniref:Uncharacterized protein n=1 Tax=Blattamonas nauphoetae TaxID=2049346 RepID=A0ABQ9XWH9_9EUKA|nr:hypothetical protein BLNAU_9179 [Blattamonas nauphoetae]